MNTAAVRLTDPAFELSLLANKLKNFEPGNGTSTYSVLARFIGVDPDSPQLFELLGFVGSRSVSLMEFINSVQDEFLDDDMRAEIIGYVSNISQVISPKNMSAAWSTATDPQCGLRKCRNRFSISGA